MFMPSLLSILAVTAGSLAACSPTPSNVPAAPATKYLFTINIASPKAYVLGDTPAGQRVFEPITGGNFSGPAAHGQVISGVDYGLTDSQEFFNPDVVYLLQTSDACEILVREKGHAPNVFMLFETACSAYDYLNGVVAYGLAAQVTGGISVQVFKVGAYQS